MEGKCNPLLNDEVVQDVAKIYKKSPAQILLRWATQQGIGNIAKKKKTFLIFTLEFVCLSFF
jgi:diketogulonate reductase-like aldo/keto reductase